MPRMSHPARGAWIEILNLLLFQWLPYWSHPARGAWIEIGSRRALRPGYGRTPQGVRGLKYLMQLAIAFVELSHPARGAWIEIAFSLLIIISCFQCRTPQGVRGLKY